VLAFLRVKGLTGASAPVLVGHSSGAAVVGLAALRGPAFVRGVVFLDGDATPRGGPGFLGWLLVNPYRTTLLRLALSQVWLIKDLLAAAGGGDRAGVRQVGLASAGGPGAVALGTPGVA
jgi:pimeloyl-ACP methyl ester carboxylesterase